MKYILAATLPFLLATSVHAQVAPQTFTIPIPAGTSTTFKDSSNNTWKLTAPTATTLTLQFSPAVTPTPLANGAYNFTDVTNNLNMDSGWNPPTVGTFSVVNDSCQQWTWNGSQLSTPSSGCGEAGFLTDNGSGGASMSSPGDTLQITQSGSGYTIKDVTTGNYFASKGTAGADGVVTTSTPFVWGATPVTVTSSARHRYPAHRSSAPLRSR